MSNYYAGMIKTVPADETTRTAIIRSRIAMILNAPFFGHIVMRLQMHQVPDDSPIQTMATDGRHLFYNKAFVDKLPADELTFVMGHETIHCVFDHAGNSRRGSRDPLDWNIAIDHVTNLICEEHKIGTLIKANGFKPYCDRKYKNWSAEQVYEDLQQQKKQQKQQQQSGKGSPGGGNPGGGSPGDGNPGGGGSLEDERGSGQIDYHLGTGVFKDMGPDANGNPQYTLVPEGALGEMDGQQRQLQLELRQAVMAAAKSVAATHKGKEAGSVPAGIQRLIDEWTETRIDWRELLATQISYLFRETYSYMRPSKKSWSTNCILPGMRESESVDLAIAIDASGSIGQTEATAFLSETWGIMQMYPVFNIHLWSFDGSVHGYKRFTRDNLDELRDYKLLGGGGTSFEANWDYMKANDIKPEQFVMFTDGYPNGTWGDEDFCETIFVITTKGIKSPFGRYAHFDLNEEA
jgi:predicted metal-dependent peptidase